MNLLALLGLVLSLSRYAIAQPQTFNGFLPGSPSGALFSPHFIGRALNHNFMHYVTGASIGTGSEASSITGATLLLGGALEPAQVPCMSQSQSDMRAVLQ